MSFFASYFKCALQVNPYSYSTFRGETVESEDEYNRRVLEKCKQNNISVVGLANHGNVDDSEGLRRLLEKNGIVVFPGFEIMSAEKIHMVCLFPETKTLSDLNRYLGSVGLSFAEKGNETSEKTCLQIAKVIEDVGGFWYAAHITSDNGILKLGKLNTVWTDEKLIAAQIPDSRENVDPKYKNIINNTDPQYHRIKMPALINASDIDKPEDLDRASATTWIKMSKPTFSNFIAAFFDPESRIRLNSEMEENYQSGLKSLKVVGGYLDGLDIDFSDNLVSIIGGRGTGKSTIISLIRYALDLSPKDKKRAKEYEELIENNLGSGGRVELTISSNAHHNLIFKIIRRYRAMPVIEDEEGKVSSLTVHDILPSIEIYGQNEIVDAVNSPELVNVIVTRLFKGTDYVWEKIREAYDELIENGKLIKQLEDAAAKDEEESADLPALQERLRYFQEAGFEAKLELLTRLTNEEAAITDVQRSIPTVSAHLQRIDYPSKGVVEIDELLSFVVDYNNRIAAIEKEYADFLDEYQKRFRVIKDTWDEMRDRHDSVIKESLASIQGINDRTGAEIAAEYRGLLLKVKQAEPIQTRVEKRKQEIERLYKERATLIEKCRKCWDDYAALINQQIKKLNKRSLKNIVNIAVKFRQRKDELLQMLKTIDGIGDKSILGIDQYEDFDVFTFAEDVRKGAAYIKEKYSLTAAISEKIAHDLDEQKLRAIEEMILPDLYIVSLFVNGKFKELRHLSKGQQCTAILHIILLENKDPLIIDQPEDNLDNTFIAEDLVSLIREHKTERQYIFATHNANIPVFGDAELIVAMEEVDGIGVICNGGIGSVDSSTVREHVIRILEGGRTAFKMREKKYGIQIMNP